jgi:hypothetical protein
MSRFAHDARRDRCAQQIARSTLSVLIAFDQGS